jgi:hypothetical protein
MPKLTVEGVGEFEVPQGKRLVLALEDEALRRDNYSLHETQHICRSGGRSIAVTATI